MKHLKTLSKSPAYALDFDDDMDWSAVIDYIISVLQALKTLFEAKGLISSS